MRRIIAALALLAVPAAALALNFSVSLRVYRLQGPAGELRTVVYENDMRGADDVASLLHGALDSAEIGGEAFPGWKLLFRARCFDDDGHGGGPVGVPRCHQVSGIDMSKGYPKTDLKMEEIPKDWLVSYTAPSAVIGTLVKLALTFPIGWLLYLPFVSLVFPKWSIARRRWLSLLPYGLALLAMTIFPVAPIVFGFVVLPLLVAHGVCSGVAWYAWRFMSWCGAHPEKPLAARALARPGLMSAVRWSPFVFSALMAAYLFLPFALR